MLKILIIVGWFFFSLRLANPEEEVEKLEDYSKYGYTLKYKKPEVYSIDPGEKKSFYHQGEPQLPPTLSDKHHGWAKPEKLQKVEPEELYIPPPIEEIIPLSIYEEEKIKTKEGELTIEELAEKIEPVIERVTGKEIEVKVIREEALFVQPITPMEEEEEESQEEPREIFFSKEWKIFIKEGRLTLKPPSGVAQEDLDKIAAYLVDLLGRGGEITYLGPDGIEIRVK